MPNRGDPDAGDHRPLPVVRVAEVPPEPPQQSAWLIENLWGHEAVGVLGGQPKTAKTFLALEMALAVASGSLCLGRFPVPDPGPVLFFAAEDAPAQIRTRLDSLAQARDVDFSSLPVFLILTEQLRLDLPSDHTRLTQAVDTLRPRLLILDPFVRIHRQDENSARDISPLLADLRALQRRFQLAILVVHHTRKTNGQASGQDLRGSGDLYAWGDSYLYLRRSHDQLQLTVEHRAARAPEPVALTLTDDPPHLEIDAAPPQTQHTTLQQQVLETLHHHPTPLTQSQLRGLLKVRNQSLTATLRQLCTEHQISRTHHGWSLTT